MQHASPPLRVETGLCPPSSPCPRAVIRRTVPRPFVPSEARAPLHPPVDASKARAHAAALPCGPYPRIFRPLLGALLVGALIPPVAAICAVIALAQLAARRRLDEVFFIQWRAGLGGTPFRILKFRTLESDPSGNLVATPLGRLLRKSHLDELPQLWNVIRGEMSLIGPRPETLELEAWANGEIPGFSGRLVIRPGITGLAQVVQDSIPPHLEAYRTKLSLNRAYLDSMDLPMDLSILVRTALRPLRPRKYESSQPEEPETAWESAPWGALTPKDLPVGSR